MPDPKEPTTTTSSISHRRQASRASCPVLGCGDAFPAIDERIRLHLQSQHAEFIKGKNLNHIVRNIKRPRMLLSQTPGKSGGRLSGPGNIGSTNDTLSLSNRPPRERSASPIEDDGLRDGEAWSSVSRCWYTSKRIESLTGEMHKLRLQMKTISEEAKKDAVVMRTITIVTLIFLPGTFVASLPCGRAGAYLTKLPVTGRLYPNELFEPNFNRDGQRYGNRKKRKIPEISDNLPFHQHSDSYKSLSNLHNMDQFPLDLGYNWGSKNSLPDLLKQVKLSLKYYILSLVPSLACIAAASVTASRPNLALESRQPEPPSSGSDNVSIAWLWYPTAAAGILVGEFAAVYILHDPLLLHGVSMAISAGAYLLMVFHRHEIPFHIQFSTWGMCAIYTIAWTYYDTLNLRPEMKRLAVLAVIVTGFLLDSGISSVFASVGSSVFATNDSPSIAFMFATFLLPCMAMSAFLCSGIQGIYHQVTQRGAGRNTTQVQTG
ncbi:hypothetical protein F4803DRAFT_534909 [Xylaria telfairii]|nr:hypothetical protein F4803DRAFT_534909 [Xylaria telfairii]